MDFAAFREIYPLREPKAECIKNEDELVLLPPNERLGLLQFPEDASDDVIISSVPRSHSERGQLYLWVVAANDVPFALESAPFGQGLETGKIKHTNLTGGESAHCGGELWFLAEGRLLLSASSGRYGPKSEQEMTDVALAFKNEGFEVASLGFDVETGYPCTVLVGEPKWM
ncbi:hypothetical protein ACSVIJ_18955 [Pseudomonas sp. NCHU5208]|uniref:hypothetical protein n=1 Tax=unclassified Pseudomonas TaxID=196821 RepID=UPI003F9A5989